VITVPLAHAGHWVVSLLYVLPLVVIAVVATVVTIRERRRGPEPGAPGSGDDDESVS
jgi:hypothetical protein